ncbi:MAG TPA: efflux RND transporter periplasmic adaptor subunit [Saprospiraceae bacterium]|nr:efflux RND transporter periplasmic adaptor subunit [Saprospiraceae bacterium]
MNKYLFIPLFFIPLFIACHKDKPDTETNTATSGAPSSAFYVRTVPIENNQLSDAIHITGIIQSDSDAKPSFKTGGVIANTYVKEGDAVRKGQLLAKLNMTEIEAQATQAQFALDKAKRDQQRIQNLYADSIVTLEQLQNASTAVDIAQKTLQIAQFNVAYSEVRAPIDGKIITQMLHEGEIAAPGLPVYYIMGTKSSDWKLVAGLTDKNWSRVSTGNKARISLDAYPGLEITGTVKRLSDVANPLSGTFDAEITIPAKEKRIAAGRLAHVEIIPAAGKAYPVIPIEALVSSNGQSGVVYVPNNGHAEKRVVHIQQFDGERVAILSGLENATEVITAGSGFLENGDAIISEE